MRWSDRFSALEINRNLKTAYYNCLGKNPMNENKEPKRYDFQISYYDWDVPCLKKIESEFGKWVTYSTYDNLLKQFDRLEEAGIGYWVGDEFILSRGIGVIQNDPASI